MSFQDIWHYGGPFMYVLSLIALIISALIIAAAINSLAKNEIRARRLKMIKGLGVFALAFGLFGSLMGLFGAFSAIEASKEIIPLPIIMGGLKVGLITPIYGLLIFMFSLLSSMVLRIPKVKSVG